MGFLDSLIRKAVNTAVDIAMDNVKDAMFGKQEPDVVKAPAGRVDTARENKAATKQENNSGERLLRQRIEEIAAREQTTYELRQRVPSSEVAAPEGAREFFDYGFYQNGMLVAVIMILEHNNAYNLRSVRLAQQACRERQVEYMNFMSYMMNRPEYISQRLKEHLR
ncbi:MAG: hypothetical protein K2K19_02500 [Acetatifactor sp.]|nr:hypothetical protein [Acetatifactor sp.]